MLKDKTNKQASTHNEEDVFDTNKNTQILTKEMWVHMEIPMNLLLQIHWNVSTHH